MDLISLSKAIKTIKEIEVLESEIIGVEAEGRFKTVDHRLDYIEAQIEKAEKSIDTTIVDLTKGVFHNTASVNSKIILERR